MRDAHFSIGDFEYYLTDDENDDTRYHLSAFFSKGELDKGHALLNRWRTFIKDKKASVKLIRRSHSAHYFELNSKMNVIDL